MNIENKNISDEEIIRLWKDPNFKGSFSGIKTFQALLKTDFNYDVSQNRLYKVLRNEKIYLIHLKNPSNIERRSYDLNYYGELLQADIAYMFDYEGFKYFLLVIDCYSNKIFIEPLKSLDAENTVKAFKKIFKEFQAPIYEVQTDKGFTGKAYKEFFKQSNILLKFKQGKNKANFAEFAIRTIKIKLYKYLRSKVSQNWPQFIEQIVKNQNELPLKKLGFLAPNDVTNVFDSVKVKLAQKKINFEKFSEPNFQVQAQNKDKYSQNTSNLQVGDYVYLNFPEKLFDKSFDVKVSHFLLISTL